VRSFLAWCFLAAVVLIVLAFAAIVVWLLFDGGPA